MKYLQYVGATNSACYASIGISCFQMILSCQIFGAGRTQLSVPLKNVAEVAAQLALV